MAWDRLVAGTQASRWLALLGRHSLLFYTAHVFTEIPIMEFVWQAWPPAALRMGLTGVDLAALTALYAAAETGILALAAPWPRLARGGAVLAVAASLAMLVVGHAPIPDVAMTVVDDADTIGDALEPASEVDVSADVDAAPADEPATPDVEPDVTLA
jgi:hypothetical protein